jgi:hypothetical protein
MAAARALFIVVLAISALGVGVFMGGAIAQPALLDLMPWYTARLHTS